MVSIVDLPYEILEKIFISLPLLALVQSVRVSKSWQQLAAKDDLWKPHFSSIPLPEASIKAYLDIHCIKSIEDISLRFKKYADTMTRNELGRFLCISRFNPLPIINVEVSYLAKSTGTIKPDEICIATIALPNNLGTHNTIDGSNHSEFAEERLKIEYHFDETEALYKKQVNKIEFIWKERVKKLRISPFMAQLLSKLEFISSFFHS